MDDDNFAPRVRLGPRNVGILAALLERGEAWIVDDNEYRFARFLAWHIDGFTLEPSSTLGGHVLRYRPPA